MLMEMMKERQSFVKMVPAHQKDQEKVLEVVEGSEVPMSVLSRIPISPAHPSTLRPAPLRVGDWRYGFVHPSLRGRFQIGTCCPGPGLGLILMPGRSRLGASADAPPRNRPPCADRTLHKQATCEKNFYGLRKEQS